MAHIAVFSNMQEVKQAIEEHEQQVANHYVADDAQGKYFHNDAVPVSARIRWQISSRKKHGLSLEFDGIPFIFMGKRTYICHHGRDKGLAMKRKYKEAKEKRMKEDLIPPKSRNLRQQTKKMGCPARIEIKKIAKFPEFKVSSTSKFTRQQLVGQMRKALQNTSSPPTADIKYLVYLPSKDEHHCYQTEPKEDNDPMDPLVKEKLLELLGSGIRNRKNLAASLKEYVINTIFHGQEPPKKCRRYFPHASDMAKLILKYRLGKRFTKMDNITMERMLQETDPDNQNIFRLHDSSVEDTQVDQTAAEDGTMELSSHVHSSGQCLPNDEIVMQYDAHKEESDYSKVAEGFVEVQPVDLPLSHNTFETLLTTARSTLEQITHLTYKFKDDGNLEEMSNWVDSLGHSLHQAQAFVIKEDGLVLQSTSISDPPTGESRPSECISSFQHPASGRVYCENTLQGFTYENCNPD